jgi:hypothetical protein
VAVAHDLQAAFSDQLVDPLPQPPRGEFEALGHFLQREDQILAHNAVPEEIIQ